MSSRNYTGEAICGHCHNNVRMPVMATHSRVFAPDPGDDLDIEAQEHYEICECPACNKVTVRTFWWNDTLETEEDTSINILFPSTELIPMGLPKRIEAAFAEALKVKSVSANAFGILLGRLIELVCLDKNCNGGNLEERIKKLHEMGVIPQPLENLWQELRHFRNIGAHGDEAELRDEEVPIVESLSRAVLDYVYTAPALLEQAKGRIQNLKAKSA